MCGIYFSCSQYEYLLPSSGLFDCLKRRGPDAKRVIQRKIEISDFVGSAAKKAFHLTFISTVLSLRGNHVVRQPLEESSSGSLLCWNGEAWKIDDRIVDGNDVQSIFNLLLKAAKPGTVGNNDSLTPHTETLRAIINVFARISGPYSFVFYDAGHQRVFYGRDLLGRRSLLSKIVEDDSFVLSSIGNGCVSDTWTEVEANGIHMLNLTRGQGRSKTTDYVLGHMLWSTEEKVPESSPSLVRSSYASARFYID